MTTNINRISKALECAERLTGRQFTQASNYAEPGYSSPERGIVFGNWNPKCGFSVPKAQQERDPISKLARILEKAGFELEWQDEWTTCCDCGKALRTSPDCYQWTSYYRIVNECEIVCLDCLDPSEYLESIEDNASVACPPDWNPEDYGYVKFNGDFETGFHPGQTDNPSAVLKRMHAQGLKRVVFKIAEQSQFYTVWQAYYFNEQSA